MSIHRQPRRALQHTDGRDAPAHTTVNCRTVDTRMAEYLDEDLAMATHRRFTEHIDRCVGCTAYVAQFRSTTSILGGIDVSALTPALRRRLLGSFGNHRGSDPL